MSNEGDPYLDHELANTINDVAFALASENTYVREHMEEAVLRLAAELLARRAQALAIAEPRLKNVALKQIVDLVDPFGLTVCAKCGKEYLARFKNLHRCQP